MDARTLPAKKPRNRLSDRERSAFVFWIDRRNDTKRAFARRVGKSEAFLYLFLQGGKSSAPLAEAIRAYIAESRALRRQVAA